MKKSEVNHLLFKIRLELENRLDDEKADLEKFKAIQAHDTSDLDKLGSKQCINICNYRITELDGFIKGILRIVKEGVEND